MIIAGRGPLDPATAVQQRRKNEPVRNLGMRDSRSHTSTSAASIDGPTLAAVGDSADDISFRATADRVVSELGEWLHSPENR